jgi:hypothetical protein
MTQNKLPAGSHNPDAALACAQTSSDPEISQLTAKI